jgi:tRNA-modifying protein YgfZ
MSEDLIADDEAVRLSAAVVPVARDALRVFGPDAVTFMQGQCSQDVEALAIGDGADALLLTPQGKLDALVRVTRLSEDAVLVDVDGGWGPVVAARLERFKIRVKVTIEELDWSCVAVRGPQSAAVVEASGGGGDAVVLPYGWGPISGVDVMGVAPSVPGGVRMCSPEAWSALRIEAGICVMGAELDERTIAAEADLLERCVSFTKGCYTGQELVARLDARGNRVARHLRGLVVLEPADAMLSPGAEVFAHDAEDTAKAIGTVTSAGFSAVRGRSVGLGYLHRTVEPPAPVVIRSPGEPDVHAEARELPLTR